MLYRWSVPMKIQKFVSGSLILAIGSNYDTVWRDLNEKLKEESCNLLQAIILIAIFFEQSEAVTPSDLADILGATRGNVSHCISHLERRGFLRRTLNEKDARSYNLVLKPAGKKTALRLIQVIDGLEDYFERQLGKQVVQSTIDSMNAVRAAYRKRLAKGSNRSQLD
jgi:DNA-binding MarR family transcriptional regulator